MQQAKLLAIDNCLFRVAGLCSGPLIAFRDYRVQLTIDTFDSVNAGLDNFNWRYVLAANHPAQLTGVQVT